MSYYFTIIGTRDNPLYEVEFASFKLGAAVPGRSQFAPAVKEILPFVTHSSLDLVDDLRWSSSQFHLGKIDSFYGIGVHAFLTQGSVKLLMCSDQTLNKHDENALRQFFMEAYELYVKCLANPFYRVNDAITSPEFDLRVKLLAKKYL